MQRFPMHFSKKHLPRKQTTVILKNSAGKEWTGSYLLEGQNSRKGLISRGWTNFARDNHLEEDDYCVFELVERNKFLVHIFRVVDMVVPPVWVSK
jgi:B3 DNA binding domain